MIEKSGGKNSPEQYGIDWDARDEEMDLEDRLTDTGYIPGDNETDNPLRPRTF